jgi:hypothetical protein
MNVKKSMAIVILLMLSALLFTACGYSQSDLEYARQEGYSEGHSDGYNEGYTDGEEDAIDNLAEKYPDGRLIYMSNETIDELLFFVDDSNGMEYGIHNYIAELSDYCDEHRYFMSSDEEEAANNLMIYAENLHNILICTTCYIFL